MHTNVNYNHFLLENQLYDSYSNAFTQFCWEAQIRGRGKKGFNSRGVQIRW